MKKKIKDKDRKILRAIWISEQGDLSNIRKHSDYPCISCNLHIQQGNEGIIASTTEGNIQIIRLSFFTENYKNIIISINQLFLNYPGLFLKCSAIKQADSAFNEINNSDN